MCFYLCIFVGLGEELRGRMNEPKVCFFINSSVMLFVSHIHEERVPVSGRRSGDESGKWDENEENVDRTGEDMERRGVGR